MPTAAAHLGVLSPLGVLSVQQPVRNGVVPAEQAMPALLAASGSGFAAVKNLHNREGSEFRSSDSAATQRNRKIRFFRGCEDGAGKHIPSAPHPLGQVLGRALPLAASTASLGFRAVGHHVVSLGKRRNRWPYHGSSTSIGTSLWENIEELKTDEDVCTVMQDLLHPTALSTDFLHNFIWELEQDLRTVNSNLDLRVGTIAEAVRAILSRYESGSNEGAANHVAKVWMTAEESIEEHRQDSVDPTHPQFRQACTVLETAGSSHRTPHDSDTPAPPKDEKDFRFSVFKPEMWTEKRNSCLQPGTVLQVTGYMRSPTFLIGDNFTLLNISKIALLSIDQSDGFNTATASGFAWRKRISSELAIKMEGVQHQAQADPGGNSDDPTKRQRS
ncbi:hypothetical protein BDZ88DRAFT_436355 [Geranomyces variabilis]|nr:hypothetical protein BDZ88DRAFT_436355 [Geranomyces variabilis]